MTLKAPPAYPPGTKAQYSNRGTIVAALIAEDATGLSYETLMQREAFGPLGMRTATFASTRPGELVGHEKGKPRPRNLRKNCGLLGPAVQVLPGSRR